MFRKIEVSGKSLTLELAREFRDLTPLPGEREIKPARREYLLKQLQDGTFGGPNWSKGIDKENGTVYRLDGQHSSNLLAGLPGGTPFPEGLLATIDTYEFDSVDQDGDAIFNLFNHPKSARNTEDAIGLYKARVTSLAEIDRGLLVKIGNGIVDYQKELSKEKQLLYPPRKRGLYFSKKEFEEFALWVASYGEVKNEAFFTKGAVVAEMLQDFLVNREQANEFWGYVLRENHPEADHETRALAETFRDWSKVKKYKPLEYRKKAQTAWKHYLREERKQPQQPRLEPVPV